MFRRILVVVLLLVGAACGVTQEDQDKAVQEAERIYSQIVQGDLDAVSAQLPAEFQTDEQRAKFPSLRDAIPEGDGLAGKLVGFNRYSGTNGDRINLAIVYTYADGNILYETVWRRANSGGDFGLFGLRITPIMAKQIQEIKFDLKQLAKPPAKPSASDEANDATPT